MHIRLLIPVSWLDCVHLDQPSACEQGLLCIRLCPQSADDQQHEDLLAGLQVNRLELTLSIGSFAAAIGAMVAGIFGMNLRSTLEESVIGFWGTTALIVLGCVWVFVALYNYTKRRRIL